MDFDFGKISYVKGQVQFAQLFTCAGDNQYHQKHRISARKKIGKEIEVFNRSNQKNRWSHAVFNNGILHSIEP